MRLLLLLFIYKTLQEKILELQNFIIFKSNYFYFTFLIILISLYETRMENKEKRRKLKSSLTVKRNESIKEMKSQKGSAKQGSYISNKQIKQS